jgi:PAS domain S-box-containing protein
METRAGDDNNLGSTAREGRKRPASDPECELRRGLFFETSSMPFLLANNGEIVDANAEVCRILHQSREELLATGLDEVFDTSDPYLEAAREEQRRTGRFEGQLYLLRKDGTPFPAEVSMVLYEAAGKEVSGITFRDIGERKRIEEELRQSKEFFRTLVENTLDVISVHGTNTEVRYVNPAIRQALGYRSEEFVGMRPPDLVHPDDFEQAAKDIAAAFESFGPYGLREHRYRHKDGSYRYLQAHVSNLLDDPNIRGIVSSVRDVTERRRIEEELRFFRVLVENMLDFIAVLEPDTTARYLSPSVERVLGYRSEELVGTKMYDLVHPDDIERGMKDTAEVIGAPGPAGRLPKTRRTTRMRVQLS